MRSIIYRARHRPLNIPRSTKEYSRATPELFRASIREYREMARARRYFREPVMALEKSSGGDGSRGRGTCRQQEGFLRHDRCGRIDNRATSAVRMNASAARARMKL